MIIYPVLAAIIGSSEITLSRFFLTKFKIKSREYLTSDFLVIILSMTIFLPIFYQHPTFLLDRRSLLYFIGIIIAAIFGNLFYTKALNSDKITTLEPFRIFGPFIGTVIAFLFFREEITTLNVTLIIVATVSLLFSQDSLKAFKKHKGIKYIILSMILFAFEPFFLKQILIELNPVMMYYIRGIFVFILLYIFFRPKLILFEKEKTSYITTVSLMSTVKKILVYFAYLHLGVLNTLLILKIRYPLEYLLANITLKEKLKIKNLVTSSIILASVILYALYS